MRVQVVSMGDAITGDEKWTGIFPKQLNNLHR